MMLHSKKGFSLVEMMMTVMVLGVLSSLAVIRMQANVAKVKMSEVQMVFSSFRRLMDLNYEVTGSMTASLDEIGFGIQSRYFRYSGTPFNMGPGNSGNSNGNSNSNNTKSTENRNDDYAIVCRNGNTIAINRSALQAHLNQGHTEGFCDGQAGSEIKNMIFVSPLSTLGEDCSTNSQFYAVWVVDEIIIGDLDGTCTKFM